MFASVQGYDTVGPAAAQAGYTRYNLFGRGGFASVALSTNVSDEYAATPTRGLSRWASRSWATTPSGPTSTGTESNDDTFFSSRSEARTLGLAWIYDTTDDPVFPTSGTRLVGSASYLRASRGRGIRRLPVPGELRLPQFRASGRAGTGR